MKEMRSKTRALCRTALGCALLCILAPITLPATPAPVTLSLFALFLAAYVLPPSCALAATLCYVALGALGLPVFSGFMGGLYVLAGPTGGFVAAYIPMAYFLAKFKGNLKKNIILMIISTTACYILGSFWIFFTTGANFFATLVGVAACCALPDGAKIICAAIVGERLRRSRR